MQSTDIRIKVVGKEDQAFLYEMLYQSIYQPPGTAQPDRDIILLPEISKYVEHWGRPGDYALIALDSHDNQLGAVWLRYLRSDNRGYGYVSDDIPEIGIAVEEGQRGRGIGSVLLEELLNRTKQQVPSISLSVQTANPAMRLYEKFGFYVWSEADEAVIMRRDR
ncbi:MAG: GNAT family N-acetyltransferase [Spirochaetia bacterium]